MVGRQRIFKFNFPYETSISYLPEEIIGKLSIRLEQYNIDLDNISYINVL